MTSEETYNTFEDAIIALKEILYRGDYYTQFNPAAYIAYDRDTKLFEIRHSAGGSIPIDEHPTAKEYSTIRLLEIETGTIDENIQDIIQVNQVDQVSEKEQRELIIDDFVDNLLEMMPRSAEELIAEFHEEKERRDNSW